MGRLQREIEAKNVLLQQIDTQFQQQGSELQERTTQLNKQKEELQKLRVRNWIETLLCMHDDLIMVCRRTEEDWRQK